MEKIKLINEVVKNYFDISPLEEIIPAKDLMPHFIKAGIFEKDEKNGLPIRKLLRKLDKEGQLHLIPQVLAIRKAVNTNWFLCRTPELFPPKIPSSALGQKISKDKSPKVLKSLSDESYVIDLCDQVLGRTAIRQHRFDFLLGDAGTKLPVDAYYQDLNLVIEYLEYQHTNSVRHFDKPNLITISGVHRGEQRKIYDQRRRDVLPQHGIKLIEICYSDLKFDGRNRLVRDEASDLIQVSNKVLNNH